MIIKFDDIVPRPFPDDTSQENYWLHRTIMSGVSTEAIEKAIIKREFNIKLIIDGVPHDPKLINEILKNIEEHIDKEAKIKFEEAMSKGNILNEIIDEATNKICEEFNIDKNGYDY